MTMLPGTVKHVCTSIKKGVPKHAVESILLVADHGVQNDAHAGDWHRQVSLLDMNDIEEMRAKGLDLKPGAFGENLVLADFDMTLLGIGSRIAVGDTELEITQIGKVCHSRCAIYHRTGDCIMPRAGIFAKVNTGGKVTAGMPVTLVERVSRETTQAAIVTVSDRGAAGETEDTAGPAVTQLVQNVLHANIAWAGVIPDDQKRIENTLKDMADRSLDLVVTVGGTGCGPRDVTPEATRAVIEREVPGLAEAMRAASLKITPQAMIQRGVCGIRSGTLIVNLPGSQKGSVENLQVILTALPHAIRHLRGDTAHPEADAGRTLG